jgi:hypothetical protein
MDKPYYDYQLVLDAQKRCNGANVHHMNTLLSQYECLFEIAEDAGEYTFINGSQFHVYGEIERIHP